MTEQTAARNLTRLQSSVVIASLAFLSVLVALALSAEEVLSPTVAAFTFVATAIVLTIFVLLEGALLAALGFVALAGLAQATASIWFPAPVILYLDDLPLLIVIGWAVAVAASHRLVAELRLLAFVGFFAIVALLRAHESSAAIYQARQLLVPFLIAFVSFIAIRIAGSRDLLGAQSQIFIQIAVVLTFATCLYMFVEWIWGPPLNPVEAYQLNSFTKYHLVNGQLGNYLFYPGDTSKVIVRLGGLIMNPPVEGIFLGGSVVVTFWRYWHWRRIGALILCGVSAAALFATYSRGGILIALVGIGLPLLVRYTSRPVAGIVGLGVAVYLGNKIGQQGASSLHYEGLVDGLGRAFRHPLGEGFAKFGDVSNFDAAESGEGESLLAIAFASVGLPAVVLVFAAFWYLFRDASIENWPAGLGLGLLTCALFTESAGSLSGTVLVWAFCGVGLGLVANNRVRVAQVRAETVIAGPHPGPSAHPIP